MAGPSNFEIRAGADEASREYLHHSSAQRVNTDIVIIEALRKEYPELKLTAIPAYNANLLSYATGGHAKATPVSETESWSHRLYIPPGRRLDGGVGALADGLQFGKFIYTWHSHEYILYVVDGRDGTAAFGTIMNYLLSTAEKHADDLILAAGLYSSQLHDELWVFDQGYWQKNRDLWQGVQKAEWDDVILDADMKEGIIADVENFFDSRDTYQKLKVPWKRGVIYYGPPGNGKTISIKAMSHALYRRKEPIPTLYVRTLTSIFGPEASIASIFNKARKEAPCYLVFEDLDSIVDDRVRSYFLNEVDGLKQNDGILMVGSTNHLERLDPGISKRPSRFDRKYKFDNPNFEQRIKYCNFWQSKLSDNKDIEFPDKLCPAIAKITDKFSFAYMQEAFVAALLAIASHKKHQQIQEQDSDLDDYLLWREIKKTVKILREELEAELSTRFAGMMATQGRPRIVHA